MVEQFLIQNHLREVQTRKGYVYTLQAFDGHEIPHMHEAEATALLQAGCEIAADAFGVEQITPEFEQDVFTHLVDHHVIFAYDIQGKPQGFGSFDLVADAGKNMLYVSGLVIKHQAQKHGIGMSLVEQALTNARRVQSIDYIGGRTQNPVVAHARMHYCDPVFPITAQPDEEVVAIAQALHTHLNMINPLDPHTLITKNAYAHALAEKRPRSGHSQVDTFFRKVGPRDSVFIIGRPII